MDSPAEVQSIYDFIVKDINGNNVSLNAYRGKVLLIVNVASQCGLTQTNYKELTDLYNQYKGSGKSQVFLVNMEWDCAWLCTTR
jgi:glutathione peroxidase-family protein